VELLKQSLTRFGSLMSETTIRILIGIVVVLFVCAVVSVTKPTSGAGTFARKLCIANAVGWIILLGAVYRFNHDHWTLDQALAEMDQYEFDSGFGHGKQRDFVKDYWQQFQANHTQAAASATANR
jgi:hypothetical protein